MAVSQNGYQANNRALIGTYSIPGGKITIRNGDVAVVLSYVATRFHNEVEGLEWPGNWGYAERAIRGSTQTSNHASGTAIDLNAPRHPLGKVGTFSAAQRNAIRSILNFCEGVVRWGGDYNGRKDEMHFEIDAGEGSVARIANKIRAAGGVTVTDGAPSGGGGGASDDVKWIQQRLVYWGVSVTVDGYKGAQTTAAIKTFQLAHGLEADGLVGPKTRAALTANRPDAPPSSNTQYHAIGIGGVSDLYASGEQCRKDQADLNDTGFKLSADGFWGPGSVKVAKAFQKAAGLTQDGAFGPASRAAIHKVPSWGNGHTAREWQQALKNRGWHITVDNKWGPHSVSILKQFQAEKGLMVDGLRGPESWTALYTRSP
jgi:peptidoglycan hydrolase-like protein with peptidoglycan-binding domain